MHPVGPAKKLPRQQKNTAEMANVLEENHKREENVFPSSSFVREG